LKSAPLSTVDARQRDLEVGLAIAVDVAFDRHIAAVIDNVQLARFAVEVSATDKFEILIAVPMRVGIDAAW
jgi:hypothetical protein